MAHCYQESSARAGAVRAAAHETCAPLLRNTPPARAESADGSMEEPWEEYVSTGAPGKAIFPDRKSVARSSNPTWVPVVDAPATRPEKARGDVEGEVLIADRQRRVAGGARTARSVVVEPEAVRSAEYILQPDAHAPRFQHLADRLDRESRAGRLQLPSIALWFRRFVLAIKTKVERRERGATFLKIAQLRPQIPSFPSVGQFVVHRGCVTPQSLASDPS